MSRCRFQIRLWWARAQYLQRGGQLGVAGHGPMVVPIGPHQLSEHLGVAGIRFGPGRRMALSVAAGCQWVDRIDLVAGRQQCSHEEATIRLDAHHHLVGLLGMVGQQRVELTHAFEAFSNPSLAQHGAGLVQHAHVVVRLRPIDADVDPQNCTSSQKIESSRRRLAPT